MKIKYILSTFLKKFYHKFIHKTTYVFHVTVSILVEAFCHPKTEVSWEVEIYMQHHRDMQLLIPHKICVWQLYYGHNFEAHGTAVLYLHCLF